MCKHKVVLPLVARHVRRGNACVLKKYHNRSNLELQETLENLDRAASLKNRQSWSNTVFERDRASYWKIVPAAQTVLHRTSTFSCCLLCLLSTTRL